MILATELSAGVIWLTLGVTVFAGQCWYFAFLAQDFANQCRQCRRKRECLAWGIRKKVEGIDA